METDNTMRQEITDLAKIALKEVKQFLQGGKADAERLNTSLKVASMGIKIEHMNQVKDIQYKTFAMRLIRHLPAQVDKDTYIKMTSPIALPMLKAKPAMK